MLDEWIESLLVKSKSINPEELKGLGSHVYKLMYTNWGKSFKELTK